MGTGSFPGVKSGRGVTLTPHPLLVPWSWKSRAISLLPLWAVRPVQSLSACTKVYFTFYLRIYTVSYPVIKCRCVWQSGVFSLNNCHKITHMCRKWCNPLHTSFSPWYRYSSLRRLGTLLSPCLFVFKLSLSQPLKKIVAAISNSVTISFSLKWII